MTTRNTQEALDTIEQLISDGCPYTDADGNQWYGDDARQRIPHLAGQGCLSWFFGLFIVALFMLR